jgi:hypothetical protein
LSAMRGASEKFEEAYVNTVTEIFRDSNEAVCQF